MTEQQLSKARSHIDYQMRAFGIEKPNVEFRHGVIEDLKVCLLLFSFSFTLNDLLDASPLGYLTLQSMW